MDCYALQARLAMTSELDSSGNALSPSLRGVAEAIHKDKAQKAGSTMDCHDSATAESRNDTQKADSSQSPLAQCLQR